MKCLIFLLFSAFVSVSVLDGKAWPAGTESGKRKRPEQSSSLANIEAWAIDRAAKLSSNDAAGKDPFPPGIDIPSKPFDPIAVRAALSPVLSKKLSFRNLFVRILAALKTGDLKINDAESFIERTFPFCAQAYDLPHFIVFRNILKLYGKYENHNDENQEDLLSPVKTVLDLVLFPNPEKREKNHVTTEKLAPLITELIQSTGNAADIAEGIGKVLFSNFLVDRELYELFPHGRSKNIPPHTIVYKTINARMAELL